LITAYAASKGSYQEMDDVDVRGLGVARGTAHTVEAFGCMLQLTDVLNATPNASDAHTVKVKYKVCGKDFVRINGIPYLKSELI